MAEGFYRFEGSRVLGDEERVLGDEERVLGDEERGFDEQYPIINSSGRGKIVVREDSKIYITLLREKTIDYGRWSSFEEIYSEEIEGTALDLWSGETFILMKYFAQGRIFNDDNNNVIHHIVWRMMGRSPGFYKAVSEAYPSFTENYERWQNTGTFPIVSVRVSPNEVRTYFSESVGNEYIDFDAYTSKEHHKNCLKSMHEKLSNALIYIENQLKYIETN